MRKHRRNTCGTPHPARWRGPPSPVGRGIRPKAFRLFGFSHRTVLWFRMSDQDAQRIIHILEEIRDNQKLQLQQQGEALMLQREQFAITQKQTDRTERIQDRAEQIQAKSAQLVSGSRKAMLVILPVILVLIVYVSWLFFHYVAR
jgi:hypothetical protein